MTNTASSSPAFQIARPRREALCAAAGLDVEDTGQAFRVVSRSTLISFAVDLVVGFTDDAFVACRGAAGLVAYGFAVAGETFVSLEVVR